MNVYYNKYLILISSHGREKKFQSFQKRRFIDFAKNTPISRKRVLRLFIHCFNSTKLGIQQQLNVLS